MKRVISITTILSIIISLYPCYNTKAMSVGVASISGSAMRGAMNAVDWETISARIMQNVEDRYGFDQDIWRRAQRKKDAPRAEIFFDNTNPKQGDKVTATAVPKFFKNDPHNLYYTWYIIHTKDGTPQTATNTIKEGKIEAAKIMAKGDYDPDLDDQDYSSGGDPDKDGWPRTDNTSEKCYAPMGGADGTGGLEKDDTDVEPYASGNAYCNSKGTHNFSSCTVYTNKSSFNQYYNLIPNQSNYYCSQCASSGNVSYSTLSSNNQCCYLISNLSDSAYYDPTINYCPSSYDAAYEHCFDYTTLQSQNTTAITNCLNSKFNECVDDWNALHNASNTEGPTSQISRCFKHNFGVNLGAVGFRGYQGSTNSFTGNDQSGLDFVTPCVHQWKEAEKYIKRHDSSYDYKMGSGKFTTGEEKYWGTDPYDPDTDGDGFPDEADIIGLGQETFTWTYREGDRVGVVIEGTSMIPTDEKSAYYKIMWGYLDVCDASKKDLLTGDQCNDSNYGYGFLATRSPHEEYAQEKLKVSLTYSPENPVADPSDENKENISEDGIIKDADQITVTSSIDNDVNPNILYYNWKIFRKNSSGEWDKITNPENYFEISSGTRGVGLTSFSFTPKKNVMENTGDNIAYFKVGLIVSRTSEPTDLEKDLYNRIEPRKGYANIEIPVNKNGVKLSLHKVDIIDGKASLGEEICEDGLHKTFCPAVKYQMLAAKVSGPRYTNSDSEFSWNINGQIVNPASLPDDLFDKHGNAAMYFPVSASEGNIEEITVTAMPKDASEPVTGNRLIAVVKPTLFIKPVNPDISWPTVYTIEDENAKYAFRDVESRDMFETYANTKVSYKLNFVPDYLIANDFENISIDWTFNGTSIFDREFYENNPNLDLAELADNDRVFNFTTGENTGEYYTLGASVKKYWSEKEKSIIQSTWGISPNTLEGNTSAQIVTIPGGIEYGAESLLTNPGQILAAVGTHLPHYFMYILRLVLTMLIMFFVNVGFYSLTQRVRL